VLRPVALAASAIERGDGTAALTLLDAVRPFDHAQVAEFWPKYLRAQAHLLLNNGREAALQFEQILQHRGEAPDSMLYPLVYLGLARAAALSGDVPRARQSYNELLAFWKDADTDLPPLESARQELERIQ
jgi:predicted Zn-dependent protease